MLNIAFSVPSVSSILTLLGIHRRSLLMSHHRADIHHPTFGASRILDKALFNEINQWPGRCDADLSVVVRQRNLRCMLETSITRYNHLGANFGPYADTPRGMIELCIQDYISEKQ